MENLEHCILCSHLLFVSCWFIKLNNHTHNSLFPGSNTKPTEHQFRDEEGWLRATNTSAVRHDTLWKPWCQSTIGQLGAFLPLRVAELSDLHFHLSMSKCLAVLSAVRRGMDGHWAWVVILLCYKDYKSATYWQRMKRNKADLLANLFISNSWVSQWVQSLKPHSYFSNQATHFSGTVFHFLRKK